MSSEYVERIVNRLEAEGFIIEKYNNPTAIQIYIDEGNGKSPVGYMYVGKGTVFLVSYWEKRERISHVLEELGVKVKVYPY